MRNHLLEVPPVHLQLSLLAGRGRRLGGGHLDPDREERLHQPAVLQDVRRLHLHTGPGRSRRHGNGRAGLLRHLQGAQEAAASVLRPAAVHLPAGGPGRRPGLHLLPAAQRGAETEPDGDHDPEVQEERPRADHQGRGQAAAGVQVLRQQQLRRLGQERLDPLPGGQQPSGARQLLQDPHRAVRPQRPPVQHIQGGGRLHHQAGEVHPGPPEDHRGGRRGHRLCADHWDGVYVLPVPKSEGRAVLGESEGGNPLLPSSHIRLHSFLLFPFFVFLNRGFHFNKQRVGGEPLQGILE